MTDYVQAGVIGLDIILEIKDNGAAANVSGATVKQILLRKPNGTVVEKDAVFFTNGNDGKLKYTTIDGDIDKNAPGKYKAQAYVEMPGFTGYSTIYTFEAKRNLP